VWHRTGGDAVNIGLRLTVFVTSCTLATGCATAEKRVAAYNAKLASYQTYQVPSNYKEQVDAHLQAVLKDPDSRKVTFKSTNGGLACGTVNAKNSYGGYTGAQQFGAVFNSSGRIVQLYIFKTVVVKETGSVWYSFEDEEKVVIFGCGLPQME
jgi:hypothetical protein